MVFVARHVETRILEALGDTRIVIIQGPRQAGKTTLIERVVKNHGGILVSLDDAEILDEATADRTRFLAQAPDATLAIDELQRAPELILAMKLAVDKDRRAGQFLVTGSADLLRLPASGDSLAGRAETIELLGFSQGELNGHREQFIDRLLEGDRFLAHESDLTRHDYLEKAISGSYPDALARASGKRREKWFDDYLHRIVERDASDISRSPHLGELPRLLLVLAGRNSCELNYSDVAKEMGLADTVVKRMIDLLESLYLIQRIPAWSTNLTKRAVSRSKVSLLDTGLAARLLNVSAEGVAAGVSSQAQIAGQMLEGFVAGEVRRQKSWADQSVRIHHFRDRSSGEVDLLFSAPDGRIAGVEVKASATPKSSDFTGLRRLRDSLGDRFIGGIVLHTGPVTTPFSEKLAAVPMDILWRA